MTALPSWTPGQWRWISDTDVLATAANDGRWIISGELSPENRGGNRALIAAAPELYTELFNMVERFERCCRLTGSDDEFIKIATSKARYTLDKSRGETP